MDNEFITPRLVLSPLTTADVDFIFEIVNTPGWLTFIANGQGKTKEETAAYVQRIIDNPQINYRVARLKDGLIPIGVITYIKRDHLPYPDFGFALLPKYAGEGYAYESSKVVLENVKQEPGTECILAITKPENLRSIKLLQQLGFTHDKTTTENEEETAVFVLRP